MNNAFERAMGNVTNHRAYKAKARRYYLVSEKNYHTKIIFSENLLTTEMKRTHILMNKSVYLDLSILEMSKTVMYKFWYNYEKLKYGEQATLCYMDTDSVMIYI